MGRAIKHFYGSYTAQTTNYYDNVSTGYTVPTGKVARIGFSVSCNGGTGPYGVAGFYAGTAGSSTSGSTSNRFLLLMKGATNNGQIGGDQKILISYSPNKGHVWALNDTGRNTRVHILNGEATEKYTTRNSSIWSNYNFSWANSNSANYWGTLGMDSNSQSWQYAWHPFPPSSVSNYNNVAWSAVGGEHSVRGETHAFAGETVYFFDYEPDYYSTWQYRVAGKLQWGMFVIEEDAS